MLLLKLSTSRQRKSNIISLLRLRVRHLIFVELGTWELEESWPKIVFVIQNTMCIRPQMWKVSITGIGPLCLTRHSRKFLLLDLWSIELVILTYLGLVIQLISILNAYLMFIPDVKVFTWNNEFLRTRRGHYVAKKSDKVWKDEEKKS